MDIFNEIITTLPDGEIQNIYIGLHWTAVILNTEGRLSCGIAATLRGEHGCEHGPDVPDAGRLNSTPVKEILSWAKSDKPTLASVGVATINALLPPFPDTWIECNAGEVILEHGRGKRVALVGHFPFVNELRKQTVQLDVLEQQPQPGDLPAEAAPDVLPIADVVAITGMTLTNHTFDNLLALCPPHAMVILLGPSTPLSPVLFKHGVSLLSGSIMTDIPSTIQSLMQGANFHQVRRAGARLVTMSKEKYIAHYH